jgi:hypothetical protein
MTVEPVASVPSINSSFLYPPLFSSPRPVRFLELEGSKNPYSDLKGRLHSADLDAGTPYEALSYAWGSPTENLAKFILDGEIFFVTANLNHALWDLRLKNASRLLWVGKKAIESVSQNLYANRVVDAICINQNSVEERNHQVAMMRDIYASCEQVVIWLRSGRRFKGGGFISAVESGHRHKKKEDQRQSQRHAQKQDLGAVIGWHLGRVITAVNYAMLLPWYSFASRRRLNSARLTAVPGFIASGWCNSSW